MTCFHVLRSGLVFGCIEGAGYRFRRYRGRRVPFSYFALPKSYSVVPTASSRIFMCSAPGHVLGDAEGVGSRFHILR
jgi:hypothetical protein